MTEILKGKNLDNRKLINDMYSGSPDVLCSIRDPIFAKFRCDNKN